MKVIKKSSQQGKWVFTDGSVPIQLRIMNSEEIHSLKHLHKTMHEYFYLLEGSMKILIDGKTHDFEKDDILLVEPGESHHIVEKSRDLKLLLLMPPPVQGDKVLLD